MFSTAILSGLAFAGLSVAQSTISLYIPGADTQPLVGSIVASDSTATTYALECAPGTDASDCGFPGVFTLTEGPSTAVYTLGGDIEAGTSTVVAFSGVIDCALDASSATCIESFTGTEANDPGMSTQTYDISYMPVVLTDGPLNTGVAAAPSNSNAAPTATATSGAMESSSASGSGASKTSGGTVQSQGASSTSTGGVPMITGNAKWVLGGAALVAALA